MAEFATIAFKTQEPLTISQIVSAFGRVPGAVATLESGVVRVRLPGLVPRRAVVIAPPENSPPEPGGASLKFLVALEDRPWPAVLVWLKWFAIGLLLFSAATVAANGFPDRAITLAVIAAVLWLATSVFAGRTRLRDVHNAFKQYFGPEMVVLRRVPWAGAPMQLREALYAWTSTGAKPGLKSEGSVATSMPVTPTPPTTNFTTSAPAPQGRTSLGPLLVPAVVSGVFSLTAAFVIFGLEGGRIEEEKAIREHERQMEEIRSQRALGADAVRFYFENRERLAVGDETSRRMMAVLSAISPPHINCVLQEAYREDSPQAAPDIATYNANTLEELVQIARQRSFAGDVATTCIGSTDRRQVAVQARIDGYQAPQGGEQFVRNPSGGGGERLETEAPLWPEGQAARETVVFVFAGDPEHALPSQRADDLLGANYLVGGLFQSDVAPQTPMVVYYDATDQGAAELLAGIADYWTYVAGARSNVRVVRGDQRQRRAQEGYLELWLPN